MRPDRAGQGRPVTELLLLLLLIEVRAMRSYVMSCSGVFLDEFRVFFDQMEFNFRVGVEIRTHTIRHDTTRYDTIRYDTTRQDKIGHELYFIRCYSVLFYSILFAAADQREGFFRFDSIVFH
jgi:hypothetical protein